MFSVTRMNLHTYTRVQKSRFLSPKGDVCADTVHDTKTLQSLTKNPLYRIVDYSSRAL